MDNIVDKHLFDITLHETNMQHDIVQEHELASELGSELGSELARAMLLLFISLLNP